MNVIDHNRFNEDFRHEIGNKAANLFILRQNGFNVPNSFAITTSCLAGCGISKNNQCLADTFKRLKPPLVVRSSAVEEDSASRSFAGIFESVLNVVTLDDYVAALLKVCRSTNRVAYKSYISEKRPIKMAILVQELVPAEHAGVVFTINPVSGNRSEMVMEYFNGLGISVVSGKTTPQHLVIDKKTYSIKKMVKSDGGTGYFPVQSGGCKEINVNSIAVTYLSDNMLNDIITVSLAIERLFGAPQDIEWAVANGKAYILQTRPVTASWGER